MCNDPFSAVEKGITGNIRNKPDESLELKRLLKDRFVVILWFITFRNVLFIWPEKRCATNLRKDLV